MRSRFILLAFAFWCLLPAQPAFSAVKYKRFPQCSAGAVTEKTCECHAGTSSRYHFCHAGNSCDTDTGKCHK
jgi:hypothetical protein